MSSMNRRRVPYHTRLKSNFDRLLYIIFFIAQIHRVRCVSVNGKASRIKPSKKKIVKKSWKKNVEKKKFAKKILKKNFEKAIMKKKCWEKVLTKKMLVK